MDEEFLTDVGQLAVDYPCIQLVEEYLVADKKEAREHVLDSWIPC